jgi:hypothetical protein
MIEVLLGLGLGYLVFSEKKPSAPPPTVLQTPQGNVVVSPAPGNPQLADLIQRCQAGDPQACAQLQQMSGFSL